MRIFLKILMWAAISFCALISFAFVAFAIYDGTFYRKELRKIQKQLNAMDGVTVLNMWGHEDITLEEISAAINIKSKGGMVIYDMWRDPKEPTDALKWHSLEQIGNYSFTFYDSNGGVGPGFSKKDLENYVNDCGYNSRTKSIELKHDGKVICAVGAAELISDALKPLVDRLDLIESRYVYETD